MNRKKIYIFFIIVLFICTFLEGCTSISETEKGEDFSLITFEYPLSDNSLLIKEFGWQRDIFSAEENGKSFHTGIDLAVPQNTSVLASASGTVLDIGFNDAYGKYIVIEHPENHKTLYGHLNSISVSIQQSVRKGSIIGESGNTGFSAEPHLHFGVYLYGEAVNPLSVLPE